MNASQKMQEYFKSLKSDVVACFDVASKARAKGHDPVKNVEISLAENMAERVVGLISVVAPQIVGSGVVERIMELEKQYGSLDWRVALKIAEEVALEKFCKFKDKKEAIDVGIRTGFAYVTVGVVSSPLDGIIDIGTAKRMDGRGEYLRITFAGPIRNAGGTAAAVSVIIADYVRKCLGYDVYDAQPDEIKRASTELQDYHERVTNLQYFPSEEELNFLMQHLPVEVNGDASESIEVSNYKDLPRVETNRIRSGFCLVLSSCIPLKAPKLWKQLGKWGKEFNLDWQFLEEFLVIQKKVKAGKKSDDGPKQKISPDYTYIADLVAGRPVLGYPLRPGGFRLRYGRSRTSGFSAQSIHPATTHILNQYVAIGTQLKTERPGKAASMTTCDSIDGPIVKLKDGSVMQLSSYDEAKRVQSQVKEILFLGDTLISYGDFFNRAHPLVPAGYCEEWWVQELEKSDTSSCSIAKERLEQIKQGAIPAASEALQLTTYAPLHPKYTFFWTLLSCEQVCELLDWLDAAKVHTSDEAVEKIVLPMGQAKAHLETIGLPHVCVNNEFVVLDEHIAQILVAMFDMLNQKPSVFKAKVGGSALGSINAIAPFIVRDKAGTFVGTRMGRPEKAKQRLLTGTPHVLFPVSDEGGRLRSFQSALDAGKITAEFALFYCDTCKSESVLSSCEVCGAPTRKVWHCERCGVQDKQMCSVHGENKPFVQRPIPIQHYMNALKKQMGLSMLPSLIKGVRGTSNKQHIAEHLAKGFFRAQYDIHVYKDGTTRYDMTQLPLTHFRPQEIGASVERLRELGYDVDIEGKKLTEPSQICELKPQDIVLPSCDASPDDSADKVLGNIAKFVDDVLEKLYKLPRFYNVKSAQDLIGHVTIVLAPHTSAGMVGRIIGFSKTQGLFAHPLLHAATRRDCDGDEACVLLMLDALLNFSKSYLPGSRGATMDTPLVLTSLLTPSEVDDMAFDVDIAKRYPLELYEGALEFKAPWDVKVAQLKEQLGKEGQYEGMMFTHDTSDINAGVRCSAYKTLPSMEEKLRGQMDLAEKLRSVEASEVARLVIEKHFLKDTKGNLRKFSMQEFRCVKCNEKFRRPPLCGKCTKCSGKIVFTISEGSVVKYLEPTISLAKKYNVSPYLQETIELLKVRVEGVFGKEAEKQSSLGSWFG